MQKHRLILGMAGLALLPAQTQAWRGGGAYYQPHFGSNGVYYTVVPNPF